MVLQILEEQQPLLINNVQVIYALRNTLRMIDPRLVTHGERVAYILLCMSRVGRQDPEIDWNTQLVLGMFHDVGAYETEEFDRMAEFETADVWRHAVFGYLFLKYMSPLEQISQVLMFHHADYSTLLNIDTPYRKQISLMSLADRADMMLQMGKSDWKTLRSYTPKKFCPEYVELLLQAEEQYHITQKMKSGEYLKELEEYICNSNAFADQKYSFLQMLVYANDFRSKFTVAHTINTTVISMDLGRRLKLTEQELSWLYYGAFLHDIGKISIPSSILDNPGKLSSQEMAIMRTHVIKTHEIICGVVGQEICNIAVRHHEKLDGSGYPWGLKGSQLTLPERIVAVADILSALISQRSYKDVFSKQHSMNIISRMCQKGLLCPQVCEQVLLNFDEIIKNSEPSRQRIYQLYDDMWVEYQEIMERILQQKMPEAAIL